MTVLSGLDAAGVRRAAIGVAPFLVALAFAATLVLLVGENPLDAFRLILTHEMGHAIGLGDVDVHGENGRFIDDNYDPTSSATALATLTNSWAGLVDTADPSASPLALFTVADGDPGVDTLGVDILMETRIPNVLLGNLTPLQNDDFGGRQFLYPMVPEPSTLVLALSAAALAAASLRRRRDPHSLA